MDVAPYLNFIERNEVFMNGYELYNHLRGRVDRDMYADGLYRCIEGMKLEQREYFAQEVASKYIDGDGRLDLTQSRSLERLASLTAKGFYVTPLAGADFQTIINAERANALHPLDTQSYLDQIINNATQSQETKPVVQHTESTQDMINSINALISEYVTGASNQTFCQSSNVQSIDALPMQGWKFHISADNLILNFILYIGCFQNAICYLCGVINFCIINYFKVTCSKN